MKPQKLLQKPIIVGILALICCGLWGSAFPCIKIGYQLLEIPSDAVGDQIVICRLSICVGRSFNYFIGQYIAKKAVIASKTSSWQNISSFFVTDGHPVSVFLHGIGPYQRSKRGYHCRYEQPVGNFSCQLAIPAGEINFAKIDRLYGLGLIGVILANLSSGGIDFDLSFQGEGFVFISAISYAFSSVYLKKYSKDEDPVMLSGYQFLLGGIILTGTGLCMGGRIINFHWDSSLMLIYLAFLSAVAYSLWGILLKYNPVSKVTIYGFMNPVIGVLLSAILLGEGEQAFQS